MAETHDKVVNMTIIGNNSTMTKFKKWELPKFFRYGETDKDYLILWDDINGNNPKDCIVIEMEKSVIMIGNSLLWNDLWMKTIIDNFIRSSWNLL